MNLNDRRVLKRAANRYGRYIGVLNKETNSSGKIQNVRSSIASMFDILFHLPGRAALRMMQGDKVMIAAYRRSLKDRRDRKAGRLAPLEPKLNVSKDLYDRIPTMMPISGLIERDPPPLLKNLSDKQFMRRFSASRLNLITPSIKTPEEQLANDRLWDKLMKNDDREFFKIFLAPPPDTDAVLTVQRGKVRGEHGHGEGGGKTSGAGKFIEMIWDPQAKIGEDLQPLDPNSIPGRMMAMAKISEKAEGLIFKPLITNIEPTRDSDGNVVSYDLMDKKENPDG